MSFTAVISKSSLSILRMGRSSTRNQCLDPASKAVDMWELLLSLLLLLCHRCHWADCLPRQILRNAASAQNSQDWNAGWQRQSQTRTPRAQNLSCEVWEASSSEVEPCLGQENLLKTLRNTDTLSTCGAWFNWSGVGPTVDIVWKGVSVIRKWS